MFRSACLAPPFGIGRGRGEATRDLLTSAGKEPITSCTAASASPPATSAPIFEVSISWSTSVDLAVDLAVDFVASAQGPRHRSARQPWWRLPHSRQPLAATPRVEAQLRAKRPHRRHRNRLIDCRGHTPKRSTGVKATLVKSHPARQNRQVIDCRGRDSDHAQTRPLPSRPRWQRAQTSRDRSG
jgi:hypothetical protein